MVMTPLWFIAGLPEAIVSGIVRRNPSLEGTRAQIGQVIKRSNKDGN